MLRLRTAAEAFAAEEFIAELNAEHADELRRLVRQQNDADGVDWSVEKMESVRLLEVDDDGLHLEEVRHCTPCCTDTLLHTHPPAHTPSCTPSCTHTLLHAHTLLHTHTHTCTHIHKHMHWHVLCTHCMRTSPP